MSLYLCVDCGGSKTSAVICDKDGKILGRSLGGGSNFAYIGVEAFKHAISNTISDSLKTCFTPASIDPLPLPHPEGKSYFAAAWFGISGLDSPSALARIVPIVSELLSIPPGPRLNIANDTHLLAAPLRIHRDVTRAIAVIAGTGSIVVGFQEAEDRTLVELGRLGGWGWILGDEGGGFSVGREAVRQIISQADRNSLKPDNPEPESILTAKICEKFGAKHTHDLLTLVHLPEPGPQGPAVPDSSPFLLLPRERRLSSLCPLVFECAFEHDDALSLNILRVASSTLVEQIAAFLVPADGSANHGIKHAVKAEECVICFGGSLAGIEKYRNIILDELKARGHIFKHSEFVDDAAAVGAKALASVA